MKRKIRNLLAAFVSLVFLLMTGACGGNKAAGTVKCAPCMVFDIFRYNQKVCQEFFYIRFCTHKTNELSAVRAEVNGKDGGTYDFADGELEPGIYVIRFYTPEGFEIEVKKEVDGVKQDVRIPYEKEISVTVIISEEYEDIYDYDYRTEKGLWGGYNVEIRDLDWFQEGMREVERDILGVE